MIEIKYDRSTLIQEYRRSANRTYRHKEYEEHSIELEETPDEIREEKKIPYSIAERPGYKLWKFFRSYNNITQQMELLEEPRYKLRIGNDWFEVKEMKHLV